MTGDRWHVTGDRWHLTGDRWQVTRDTWWGVNILSKFQLPSSNGLGFMMSWRWRGKGWLSDLINESMNDEGVCRAAPATPGLLIRPYDWHSYNNATGSESMKCCFLQFPETANPGCFVSLGKCACRLTSWPATSFHFLLDGIGGDIE